MLGAVRTVLSHYRKWLAIKMAANWERAPESDPFHRSGAVLAAVLGLISMGFALGGGLICKLGIPS